MSSAEQGVFVDDRLMRRAALIAWLAAVAVVVAMSLRPEPEMPMPFDEADKLYHFTGYAVLAFLPLLAFRGRVALYAASSMVLLGAALELGQSFVPGRSASMADIAANTAGVLCGIGLGKVLGKVLFRCGKACRVKE
jgi:VanZ family protein